ncbi:MAG TPA: hypothetical protein VMR88_06500, partial [Candidatus Polarisedimenticolaceae bacterium]|nr:hypothetical protein [Candidatus Polarisedimenticolaceae bacterium]
ETNASEALYLAAGFTDCQDLLCSFASPLAANIRMIKKCRIRKRMSSGNVLIFEKLVIIGRPESLNDQLIYPSESIAGRGIAPARLSLTKITDFVDW